MQDRKMEAKTFAVLIVEKEEEMYNITLDLQISELVNSHCPYSKQTYSFFPN